MYYQPLLECPAQKLQMVHLLLMNMVKVLDDCMQRCNKTPDKYIDGLIDLMSSAEETSSSDVGEVDFSLVPSSINTSNGISPLIAAVMEQFAAKLKGNLLIPSDVLALVTYIRKLIIGLLMKSCHIRLAEIVASKTRSILSGVDYSLGYSLMCVAIWREVTGLEFLIQSVKAVGFSAPFTNQLDPAVQEFLTRVESFPDRTCV